MKERYFISGIGTGVGKSFFTASLTHQLQQRGRPVLALKPIISGFDTANPHPSDTAQLLAAQGLDVTDINIEKISPWRFHAPLSPHLAAAQEEREIDTKHLLAWSHKHASADHTTLMEGVGGLMVPLTKEYLVIDWIAALGWPVILVASTYLGAINHALLSLLALHQRAIPLHAVVVSEAQEAGASLSETAAAIAAFMPEARPIHLLNRVKKQDNGWKDAPDLLSIIT